MSEYGTGKHSPEPLQDGGERELRHLLADARVVLAMYVAGVEGDKHAAIELGDGRGYHASSSAGGRTLMEEIDAALTPNEGAER